MDIKKILIIIAVILALVFAVKVFTGKNAEQNTNTVKEEEVQEFENFDPNAVDLPAPPVKTEYDKKDPNAIDVLAPGYTKSQERLKNVQDLRQKSLEERDKDLKDIN